MAKEVELVVTGPGTSKYAGDRDFCQGRSCGLCEIARERALREQNYLLLLKVRKDKRQQHMANCVVSDKSCLDVCNSLQLYRDKQGVHTTYKCIQVLHSICTKVLCLQFVQGRATHRGTNEPTNQPGQWLKLPAAMAPMSPRMCSTRLQDCVSQAIWSHLEPSGAIWSHLEPSGQLASGFCYDQNVGGALLDQPCLDGSIWLDMARYGSIWLDMARWLE